MIVSAKIPSEEDPRLLEAARDYLAELEAGRRPDRNVYLARCPEAAQALSECLDGIELAQALRPPGPSVGGDHPANPLGDFQILRELGRGGMGVVYEAVQMSLGRRVALKVLPFAAALDAKHLKRFKMEAQAAAQLHHTNIVPVHAVGCERGVHFYAMQLIEGRSLDAVIAEMRGEDRNAPPAPRGRESWRTAARIGAQVAEALEYAHDAGVIHRDIKPANLLLDAKGTVWVTDFGLAQVSADVSLTQTGHLVGTLRYMSPEQASGQRVVLDHRTDIYSLGATLYELLTLDPIFSGQDRQALLHQILYSEPRPPRQIVETIPVEVETIVLRALAKSPSERYATAGEMAADLDRFLEGKPILARRPGVVDRARKWVRRHPTGVGAAVVLLAFCIVALAVTTALVTGEQARTKAAYDLERERSRIAEARFQLARRAADDMIAVAEEELADNPFLENLRKRLLETALAYYQEFIEQRGEDPGAQAELSITRDRVKRILGDLAILEGGRQIALLEEPDVLDDLKTISEQRVQIAHLTERLDEQRHELVREFHRLSADERHRRFVDMARANDLAVSAILSPEQSHRLRQIALQGQGPQALRDPAIAAALSLNPEQKERIRALESGLSSRGEGHRPNPPPSRSREGARSNPPPKPREGSRPGPPPPGRREEAIRAAMEEIRSLLTGDQLQRWKEIFGEPFEGLVVFKMGGGPSGPRSSH